MYKTEGLESLVIAQKLLFYISGDSVMFHACIQFFSDVSDPIIAAFFLNNKILKYMTHLCLHLCSFKKKKVFIKMQKDVISFFYQKYKKL